MIKKNRITCIMPVALLFTLLHTATADLEIPYSSPASAGNLSNRKRGSIAHSLPFIITLTAFCCYLNSVNEDVNSQVIHPSISMNHKKNCMCCFHPFININLLDSSFPVFFLSNITGDSIQTAWRSRFASNSSARGPRLDTRSGLILTFLFR